MLHFLFYNDNLFPFLSQLFSILLKFTSKKCKSIDNSTPDEVLMDKIEVLMTTDYESPAAVLPHDWSFRNKIDKFYQHGKDNLGFDQYQVRSDRAIRRHWYMVFLMYSYLVAQRQQGTFTKWCNSACRTIGEMLQVIRLKLVVHWQSKQHHYIFISLLKSVS